jgi:signal transduction histidine kinase
MNLLASGMALALACAAFIAYDIVSFRTVMMRNLVIQAQIMGTNSVSALIFNDAHSAEDTLSALRFAPNTLQAVIYTNDGKVFAAYHREEGRSSQENRLWVRLDTHVMRWFGGTIEVESPILFEGKVRGAVYIQRRLQDMVDRLERYLTIVIFVFLGSMLIGIPLSFLIRRSVAEPIQQLATTARIVSSEKTYAVRVPVTTGRDELSDLIRTFNNMLGQIEARDHDLLEAHDLLEKRVEERTAQLNAANAELEAFSYSVSHDLRAPLRHMSAFSQLLAEECGPSLDADARHYVERIQESAKRMGNLVDDLLKMGQISRRSINSISTDPNVILKEVIAELQSECANRKITWRLGVLPTLDCDPGLIKQVFSNLISNAVKYTRKRETAVIDVDLTAVESETAIFVRDNGAGFDQRYADKLFGVFQRLHRSEEFEGTGVGLATVQRIIKKHGGKIWAKGEVEKGSTFFFTVSSMQHGGSPVMAAAAGKSMN